MHSNMQQPYAPNLQDLIGEKISYYCNVDMDEAGTTKEAIWMNGTVCRVSDGTWLLNERSKNRCPQRVRRRRFFLMQFPQSTTSRERRLLD